MNRPPLHITKRQALHAGPIIVGIVAALVLALLAQHAHDDAQHADELASRDAQALAVAKEVATTMLNLGKDDTAASMAELRHNAVGAFADQVDTLEQTITALLDQGEVSASGDVLCAGVEKATDDEVTVLVAARGLIRNAEIPQGQTRDYRMAMTVTHKDGKWLVSDVEFLA